jgi:hypothetical protein
MKVFKKVNIMCEDKSRVGGVRQAPDEEPKQRVGTYTKDFDEPDREFHVEDEEE